jgi:hypothetical protein
MYTHDWSWWQPTLEISRYWYGGCFRHNLQRFQKMNANGSVLIASSCVASTCRQLAIRKQLSRNHLRATLRANSGATEGNVRL